MSAPDALPPVPPEPPETPRPRRRRRLLWIAGAALVLVLIAIAAVCFWAGSPACENLVRNRLVASLETATGGHVEIGWLHWKASSLEAEVGDLVIHGREAAGEAPYARVQRLRVRISILGFFSPRILLRNLDIVQPQMHLIVYRDGTTNQPHPRKARQPGKPALDTFFDLKASHASLEQGVLDYENRAANFDFKSRLTRLDFAADDFSLILAYAPPTGSYPESYHVETGARDFTLTRGTTAQPVEKPVEGYMQATLDLTRNAVYLRSLRITARGNDVPDRTLTLSGSLTDFTRPSWQGHAQGQLDMRLIQPATGYPSTPEGIATLNLSGQGQNGQFRVDGTVHTEDAAYVDTGVNARGVGLDARVHADPEQLVITAIAARLRQGGELDGELRLAPWLPPIPGSASMQAAAPPAKPVKRWRRQPPVKVAPPVPAQPVPTTIPVNGRVTAQLKDVAIDTVLDIVGVAPFQRLGLDGRLNGPAIATWNSGDTRTLAISATLGVSPSPHAVPGEAPASGTIDATYTHRDGAVELRQLDLNMPASHLQAHGHLGAYPLHSPTSVAIDLRTGNLSEFDTVLRDLGVHHNGKSGAAALPLALGGQAEFHGTWTGSLIDPRIAGNVQGSNLTVEIPVTASTPAGASQTVRWDTLQASGSYTASRISVDHAQLTHGPASLNLQGTLAIPTAPPGGKAHTTWDADSLLHAHLQASRVDTQELLPLLHSNLPITGQLNAQIQADGPLQSLDGSGWLELVQGRVYGEPISHIRAEGKIVGQSVQLSSVTVNDDAGKLAASGSYNLKSQQFQLSASGTGIDLAHIQRLRQAGISASGRLGFSVTGSGTPDNPLLQGHGELTGVTLAGEPLGAVAITAHTANRALLYDLTTRLESAELSAHGQTELSGDYFTQATLHFSRFDIGAPLRMAHIPGLTGESSLAGTVVLAGPLAHVDQLRGEARLQDLAVTVTGVHLRSEGGLHATLANERISLDPLHITGEQTDMHIQGSVAFQQKRPLDLTASGAINLKLAQTLDPDLTASGTTTFQVQAHGTLQDPGLRGRIEFHNASLALEDLPNSLSQLNGTLEFNQNRLEVRSLTAMSGGGLLSVTGYLAYQHGIFADLALTGKGIRIRYPQGVSSLADANLQLQGPQNNLLLSGNVLITRFTVSPDLDMAALASQSNKVQPIIPPDAPSNHIRLDVHIQSSPQLNFQNAYAKLAGDVDLHLRGTLATPSLLGRISITEGSATIAGTRYELQRGDITFTNPVRIEPSIDLNANAHVEDYDITLGLHGLPNKLAVTYRSDPPLPEADVVALLALGRTQSEQRIYTQQQEQLSSNPATDALLGGALNATVSSRVQRLFGAGSVKVDPSYLGALGNSTTRITVEEQVGRNLTLTYATNVNTTAQQLLQAEIAINRHVSLLVTRDESGVFSMVVKATRRYR